MRICLETRLPCAAEAAIAHLKTPKLLFYVAAPLIAFAPHRPAVLPEQWRPDSYLLKMKLFGIIPLGSQTVAISYPQAGCFTLLDDGHSPLIRRWRHTVTVIPQQSGCLYRDTVEIDAGILTFIVGAFSYILFRHRQKRWRRLVRNGFDYGR
ncbi:hypothetical protein [Neisseria sp. CCUG12390]|uniref:hypothetical protein n=1 Tax=Neisseria sp. CCUG12390 TaxID=3392035 RepID=UPI003A0FCA21